jgi:neopullulanase
MRIMARSSGRLLLIAAYSVCATGAPLPLLRLEVDGDGCRAFVKNAHSVPLTAFWLEQVGYPGTQWSNWSDASANPLAPGAERNFWFKNQSVCASPDYAKVLAAIYQDGTTAGDPNRIERIIAGRGRPGKASIEKVEPPGWWANHSIAPVRVLLTGTNLSPVPPSTDSPYLQFGRAQASADGRYAFVDVRITTSAKPGLYSFELNGTTGSFEILPALPRAGRFQGFNENDVIYLIMVDRFANGDKSNDFGIDRANPRAYHGGDLKGIAQRLPYLKDLGVTALWLTPVYDNDDAYHGYHAKDFYAVEEHFGSVQMFRELVDAAHKLGLKVIQDQIANHTAPRHIWASNPPTPTWLNGTVEKHLNTSSSMTEGWFVNKLPDLNQNDPEAARYLIQNSLWWIGTTGIDGIRADTVPYVPIPFWKQWIAAIAREYPYFAVAGEVFNKDPGVLARFDGAGFTALFDFPLYFALRDVFAKRTSTIADLKAPQTRRVTFLGNHDVPRFRSLVPNTQAMKDAFTFLLTSPGIPSIYYGDEIAMKGGEDPDNRRDFPDPAARTPEQSEMFHHVRTLLHRRKAGRE